jgi:chaperonin GroES
MKLEKLFKEPIQNVADLLDDFELKKIYQQVSQKYQDDLSASGDKIDKLRHAIKLASLISERDVPFQGASNVVFPLASMACIQYGSTAYQALFSDDEIAKVKIIGSDAGKPQKNDKGEDILDPKTGQPIMNFVGYKETIGNRLTTTINYQLTDELADWKTDCVKAMYRLPALGTMFQKTTWNFILNRLESEFIDPDKIVVHPDIKRIENNVWSEICSFDKHAITSNIKRGLWIEYDFMKSGNQTTQSNPPSLKEEEQNRRQDVFRFVEQHTFLDLDEDGLEEPYCVVFDPNNQLVVRITPDFDLDGIKYNDGKIYFIERNESLVYFGFLPDFGGGFYSVGYAELLMNNNAAINTAINQMIDAANLRLKGGGFISTGIDLRGGSLTFKLGEYKKVNVAGGNLGANVFPMPFPEPSPVLFSLLGLLIESGKEIGSLRDVLTGDTAANMAPTTYMGLVEQGMRQTLATVKNNHESFKKTLRIVRRLNAKYLPREQYAQILDVDDPNQVSPAQDFSEKKVDLVLVTDTSAVTSAQKFAQAQLLSTLKGDPYYDQVLIRKMFNTAIQMPKLNEIVAAPPPSPDATLILAQAEDKKADAKIAEATIKNQDSQAKIGKMVDELQLMFADIKLKESEMLKNISEALAKAKESDLNHVLAAEKIITDRINTETAARDAEVQRALAQQQIQNATTEEAPSGVAQ